MSDSPLYPPSEHVQAGSTSEITNLAEAYSVMRCSYADW